MIKLATLAILLITYIGYSALVYTKGTQSLLSFTKEEQQKISEGKQLYQQKNCQACHQIYGLGGYLGPELTTAYSDRHRGEAFMRALLSAGGNRMPNFHFSPSQIDALIAYLKYVDTTAAPLK
jgi:nitric oxide reductase subunit C